MLSLNLIPSIKPQKAVHTSGDLDFCSHRFVCSQVKVPTGINAHETHSHTYARALARAEWLLQSISIKADVQWRTDHCRHLSIPSWSFLMRAHPLSVQMKEREQAVPGSTQSSLIGFAQVGEAVLHLTPTMWQKQQSHCVKVTAKCALQCLTRCLPY